MEKAFLLKTDYNQCIDDHPTIHKLANNNPDLSHLINSERYHFEEEEIYARANLNLLSNYDFVANDLNIPIVSQKFINSLALHNLEFVELVKMKLLDDKYLGELFDQSKTLNKNIKFIDSYYTIKFNLQHDFCNKERSVFRKLRSRPDSPGLLKTVVLNHPPEGFPILFKVKESISMLFISQRGKESLEMAGVKGCLYEPVEVFKSPGMRT